jgi:L-threonylcarbamoyladenylate synthase
LLISISEASDLLKAEKVVAMPTETVYGLAGRIDSEAAIREIFAVKKRPFFDPLIVHVSSLEQAKSLVSAWPSIAEILATHFWPGPLTLVLPKSEKVSSLITSGLPSVGIRMPKHPLAFQLIENVGVPLAAPSANLFGHTSPTQAQHVLKELQVPVVDGGASEVGIESTVLLIRPESPAKISILREGHIRLSQIEKLLKNHNELYEVVTAASRAESPGHLKHHYMPVVPLVLCRRPPRNEEHLKQVLVPALARIPDVVEEVQIRKPTQVQKILPLKLSRSAHLAARELYQNLRDVAEKAPDLMYFVCPPEHDFSSEAWAAVKDRLEKASSLILDEELA